MSSPSDLEPPKDLRSRRREATRQEILQAAHEVFIEVGFHEGRMETIAAKAGVSVGTLYNYFQDRSELISTLWKQHHDSIINAIDKVVIQTVNQSAEEQLRAFVRTMFGEVESRRQFFDRTLDASNSADSQDSQDINKSKFFHTTMRDLYMVADRVVSRCVASGALRSEDAALFPAMLVGLVRGVMVYQLVGNEMDLTAASEPALRFFLHGASATKNPGVLR